MSLGFTSKGKVLRLNARISRKLRRARIALVSAAAILAVSDEGEGFVDVLVKMLIVVVVGAVLLAIMRNAVPQLFSDVIEKVRGIFEV